MQHILKCQKCGKYSLSENCSCGGTAVEPRPPKYSVEDKYAKYRREVKKEYLQKKGLL